LRSLVRGLTPRGRQPAVVGLLLILISVSFPVLAETRLALLISNASYPAEIGRLENPHKDSAMVAAALENVGFEKRNIVALRDADQPTMRLAVADFIERIEKAGSDAVVFLYYSGHGAADRSERGENYLIPAGAKITLAKQLPILGVSLSEITKSLERVSAKARFVVVDACRNVAFTKGLKDAAKGFVAERKLDGMIVAFATRPGETAEDNNIYASALASILPTPGLRAEEVFKETQLKVAELSKGMQIPWTEDGLLTKFKFKEGALQTEMSRAAVEGRETQLSKAEEARRADELARAREDVRKAQEAARKAEAGRAAALAAADQARRVAEAAKASVAKAAAEPQSQKIANLQQGTDASANLARSIEVELERVGCYPGQADGRWDTKARDALRAFNQAAKAALSVDVPTEETLREVAARKGRICALSCAPNEKLQDGRCIAIVKSEKGKEEQPKETGTCWGGDGKNLVPCARPGQKRAF